VEEELVVDPVPVHSTEEARALADQVLGSTWPKRLVEFEAGWLVQEILPPDDRTVGQASAVIDRSGIVTVHPSIPSNMVMDQYAQARRQGQITGAQIWPETEELRRWTALNEQPPSVD
jgi:hypothetical protein